MTVATNETGLVRAIVAAIRKAHPDAWVEKIHGGPYQTAGIPDLIGCVEGRMFAIEVKHRKPGESVEHALGRTTARQRAQVDRIRRAGGVVDVVLDVEGALQVARAAQKGATIGSTATRPRE